MHPPLTRAAALGLALLLVACHGLPAQEPPTPVGPGDHEVGLHHGDRDRYYVLHVPPTRPQDGALAPRPLVLMLHGGGGNPENVQSYGMDRVADREGFLVVYPAGSGRFDRRLLTWNAGTCCGYAFDNQVDDVGFLRAVVADVSSRVRVDRARVYATGHSNGGMMAYRLAAEAGDLVTAVASIAGGMVCPPPKKDAPAVPVLHVHSKDDPRALYAGGLGPPFPLTNVRVQHPPVEQSLAAWVAHDGCASEPTVEAPIRGANGHTAERITWAGGRDGSEVVHWRLTGAGHGWPGSSEHMPERIIGSATTVIDANEEVWRFFARFARPVR